MGEIEQTQIVTRAREMDLIPGERVHCLELAVGDDIEGRHVVSPLGLKIGRAAPADVVLVDSAVSRNHCMVLLQGEELLVSDLGSTNGTFVDGVRVSGVTSLPIGSVLQVGSRTLKHEWRTRLEIEQTRSFDRDLEKAASYVRAMLPLPVKEGPVRADWIYYPSAKLGGDAFGYGQLDDHLFCCYLIDVAGHGAGAALHAVAVMNMLRQRSLPNTDMTKPELVLSTLNELFQMEDHAGLYFTMWYGVYNTETRQLDYASGGHHPAFLLPPDRSKAIPLRTRNPIIGAMPAMDFRQDSMVVPHGASFYLFSDGVYEIIDRDGEEWTIANFIEQMLLPPIAGIGEPQRLFHAVRENARHSILDDDFSLVCVNFD